MERNKQCFDRSAGVLLHVSSLPSPYGIGSFGETARRWADFLHDAGQRFWQILPLAQTGAGNSPYQSLSAFAGNPYFIDLDTLCEEGLLLREDYAGIEWGDAEDTVDYGALYDNRDAVLRMAFARFDDDAALDDFTARNRWFEDYSLFMVIKEAQELRPWTEWDEPLRAREPEALEKIKEEHRAELRYYAFVQYQFERQWNALRVYCRGKDVEIIGDIPIYVSLDSADVWANPQMFQLGGDGYPIEVAGCPPDMFSADGQIWGNPLYNWDIMAEDGYKWWIARMRGSLGLYDVLRFDHFRGLESYFAIPYGAISAIGGYWKRGPGKDFIDAVKKEFPDARIIAEDLGYLTYEVRELLDYSGYPGMKLLQYAFDSREPGNVYAPYSYGANSVVYTGTHDNDTLAGWSCDAPDECLKFAMNYMNVRGRDKIPDGMIRLAYSSCSNLAVIPMQDWLELGGWARMNTPSTAGDGNWRWRMSIGMINAGLAAHMSELTELFGRRL